MPSPTPSDDCSGEISLSSIPSPHQQIIHLLRSPFLRNIKYRIHSQNLTRAQDKVGASQVAARQWRARRLQTKDLFPPRPTRCTARHTLYPHHRHLPPRINKKKSTPRSTSSLRSIARDPAVAKAVQHAQDTPKTGRHATIIALLVSCHSSPHCIANSGADAERSVHEFPPRGRCRELKLVHRHQHYPCSSSRARCRLRFCQAVQVGQTVVRTPLRPCRSKRQEGAKRHAVWNRRRGALAVRVCVWNGHPGDGR